MTTTSIEFTPSQRALIKALVASGGYGTQSEIVRGALDSFVLQNVPKARLLTAAIWAYQNKQASLSRAAEMANIPHEEMHRTLVREGLFDAGGAPGTLDDEIAFLGKHAHKAAKRPTKKAAGRARAR